MNKGKILKNIGKILTIPAIMGMLLSPVQTPVPVMADNGDFRVTEVKVTDQQDGVDVDGPAYSGQAGYDTDYKNNIVRTFDSIIYTFKMSAASETHRTAKSGKVYYKFVIPDVTASEATFDTSSMKWLTDAQISYTTEGCVLTGYDNLTTVSGNSSALPVTDRSLPLVVNVLNMDNGDTVEPEINSWMKSDKSDMITISPVATTVTSAPSYNLKIVRETEDHQITDIDWSSATYNTGRTDTRGISLKYGVGFELYNKGDRNRGLKGITIPKGDVAFTLSLAAKKDGTTLTGTNAPVLYSYKKNMENGVGNLPASDSAASPASIWNIGYTDGDSNANITINNVSVNPNSFPKTNVNGTAVDTDREGFVSIGTFDVVVPTTGLSTSDVSSIVTTAEVELTGLTDVKPEDDSNTNTTSMRADGQWNNLVLFSPPTDNGSTENMAKDINGKTAFKKTGEDASWFGKTIGITFGGSSKDVKNGSKYVTYGTDTLLLFDPSILTPVVDTATTSNHAAVIASDTVSLAEKKAAVFDMQGYYASVKNSEYDPLTWETSMQTRNIEAFRYYTKVSDIPDDEKCVGILLEARRNSAYSADEDSTEDIYHIMYKRNFKVVKPDSVADKNAVMGKTTPVIVLSNVYKYSDTDVANSKLSIIEKSNIQTDNTYDDSSNPVPNMPIDWQNWKTYETYKKGTWTNGIFDGNDSAGMDIGDTLYITDYKPQIKTYVDGVVAKTYTSGYKDEIKISVYPSLNPYADYEAAEISTTETIKVFLPDSLELDRITYKGADGKTYKKTSGITIEDATLDSQPGKYYTISKDVSNGSSWNTGDPIIFHTYAVQGKALPALTQPVQAEISTSEKAYSAGDEDMTSVVHVSYTGESGLSVTKTTETPVISSDEDFSYDVVYSNNTETNYNKVGMTDLFPVITDNPADDTEESADTYRVKKITMTLPESLQDDIANYNLYQFGYSDYNADDEDLYTSDYEPGTTGNAQAVLLNGTNLNPAAIMLTGPIPSGENVKLHIECVGYGNTAHDTFYNCAQIWNDDDDDAEKAYSWAEVTTTGEPSIVKDVFDKDGTEINGQVVSKGDILTYSITVKNETADTLEFTVTDDIPENTEFIEGYDVTFDGNNYSVEYADGKVKWIIPNVGKDDQFTAEFKVKVTGTGCVINNKASASAGIWNIESNTVTNSVPTPDIPAPVKTVTDSTGLDLDGCVVSVGDYLYYTISYENVYDTESNVVVTDTINTALVEYDSMSGDENITETNFDGQKLTWKGTCPAKSTGYVKFKVKTIKPYATIPNSAYVTMAGMDNVKTNTVTNYTPEKVVRDNAGNDINYETVAVGDDLNYEIRIPNHIALIRDKGVVVEDSDYTYKKANLTYYTGGAAGDSSVRPEIKGSAKWKDGHYSVTWEKEDTPNEVLDTYPLNMTLKTTSANSTITNTAKITNKNGYVATTNTVENRTPADTTPTWTPKKYVLNKAGTDINETSVSTGSIIQYKIRYENPYNSTKTVKIEDTFPDEVEFVTVNPEAKIDDNNKKKLTWIINNVAPGKVGYVTADVRVTAEGEGVQFSNTADVTLDDEKITTNKVQNQTPVKEWKVFKTVSDNKGKDLNGNLVSLDSELVYRISVQNTGEEATTAVITDDISAIKDYISSVSANDNGKIAGNIITWNVTVGAKQTKTVSFKVKVKTDAYNKTLKNSAKVKMYGTTKETNEVVNYTPTPPTKQVLDKNGKDINGQKVKKGQEVTYKITFHNTENVSRKVTITDTIPENLKVTSIQNGGKSDGKVITWQVNVNGNGSGFVTFKAKATKNNVTINNTAKTEINGITMNTNTVSINTKKSGGSSSHHHKSKSKTTTTTSTVTSSSSAGSYEAPQPTPVPPTPVVNPLTGDSSNLMLFMAVGAVSFIGMITSVIIIIRQKMN